MRDFLLTPFTALETALALLCFVLAGVLVGLLLYGPPVGHVSGLL